MDDNKDYPTDGVGSSDGKFQDSTIREENVSNNFDDVNEMNLNIHSHYPKNEDKIGINNPRSQKSRTEELDKIFKKSSVKDTSKDKMNNLVSYILVVLVVVVGIMLVWQLQLQSQINDIQNDLQVTIIPSQGSGEVTSPTTVQNISVITPEEFSEVDGAVNVRFDVEGVENITLKLFDDNGLEIGSENIDTKSSLSGKYEVESILDMVKSPTVSDGYLIIYPADKSINSPLSRTISLSFQKNITIDRLNLISPVNNQIISGTSVRFVGEMKGFTNNEIGFSIKDEKGNEIKAGKIVLTGVQSPTGFTKFDQVIEIGSLPIELTEKGRIDLFEPDSKNRETLLTVPIRFK